MNARTILTKMIDVVSLKMHKRRQDALLACIQSLLKGSSTTVTSMGRGISNKAFEKHRIKRADRLLSNDYLNAEAPFIYKAICKLFCTNQQPVIAVDWSDLDCYSRHFLLRAALTVKGRTITLYQEVHTNQTKDKAATHKAFLDKLKGMMPEQCKPIIVTDAGYKSPWFKAVKALEWDIVGRVRKSCLYSLNQGQTWQPIDDLYKIASQRPKLFEETQITRSNAFKCSLVLVKQKDKGRHALNRNGDKKRSRASLKHVQGARDPWLLATSLPVHRNLAKQAIAIYQQRMQIEESFRDMKSSQFGLGFEQNRSIKTRRLTVLVLVATLASMVAMLIGMAVTTAGLHRRFQANTKTSQALSFHTLGLRALAVGLKMQRRHWRQTILWIHEETRRTAHAEI